MPCVVEGAVMDDENLGLSRFCCHNPNCIAFGSFAAGNLATAGFIDKARTIRQLRCRTCKKRFTSRKGTVFYRSHLPPAEVVNLLNHVQEGCGMRQTGRLTHHKEDTVIRYTKLAGRHAQRLHQKRVAFSPAHPGASVR
jgi:transposase-like protein